MITNESNINIKPRATIKVGDLAIIHGATQTQFWKTLFNKHWTEFMILALRQYLRFNRAMMGFQMWSVFRFNPGYQTTGILLTLASLCFLLSFNSVHVPIWLKPFAMFAVPFVPFFKSPEEIYQLVMTDVESQFLLIYTGLFTLTSVAHLFTIWIARGNNSITKRGESWIGFSLSRLMKVDEFVICGLLEPLITIGIGIAAWKLVGDLHFGVFMLLIALSEASQQILDKSYQAHTESILRA